MIDARPLKHREKAGGSVHKRRSHSRSCWAGESRAARFGSGPQLLVVLLTLASLSPACWLSREWSECSVDSDCAEGEICWANRYGDEPIWVCIPPEYVSDVEDAGEDVGEDSSTDADVGDIVFQTPV